MKLDIQRISARLCSGLTWSIPTWGLVNTLISNWREMCRLKEPWEMMEGLCLFLVSFNKDLIFTVSSNGVRFFVPTENGMSICVGCKFIDDGLSVNSWPVYHRAESSIHSNHSLGHGIGRPLSNNSSYRPWFKAMAWTINVADVMGFQDVVVDLQNRVSRCNTEVVPVVSRLSPIVNKALIDVVGDDFDSGDQGIFDVALAQWNIPLGKIGSFKHKGKLPWGILTISPKVLDSPGKVDHVVAHELVHAGLGHDVKDPHGKIFQEISRKIGIPEKYQD